MSENTPVHQTLVLRVAPDATPHEPIARAGALLRAGELVAFPTETVYGLGAIATDATAVARIFAAKQRPHSDPLIVHIAALATLAQVAASTPPLALALAERFWPGPLTLVLPRGAQIPALVAAGGATVGVRMPRHPVALALIEAAGGPVAAPSANRFMHTSPTTAAHALADLDGRIACVLDGGPCAVGLESTVLDLTSDPPRILRPGGITLEELRSVAPTIVGPLEPTHEPDEPDEPAHAPGQLARHYAPQTPIVVFDGQGEPALAALRTAALAALARGERVGALLPDGAADALAEMPVRLARLGPGDDLAEVSRRLYAALRALDDGTLDLLLAHTFASAGLGLALNDRLRRAAGGALRPLP